MFMPRVNSLSNLPTPDGVISHPARGHDPHGKLPKNIIRKSEQLARKEAIRLAVTGGKTA